MSQVATEHVLVVPTAVFHRLGHFQGFCGDTERYLSGLLDPAHTSYRPRSAMEQDPSFKQLIPYVIFRYRDAAGQTQLFQYTRGKGQGESRLHAKRSIGIGGHISADDAAQASAYEEGMRRELEEEVVIDTPYRGQHGRPDQRRRNRSRPRPPGRRALARCRAAGRAAAGKRDHRCRLSAGRRSCWPISSRFETWSQICLKALFA